MDKLEQIMSMQAELQRRLGTDFTDLDPRECAEFMRNHRGYLADELAEALYEMPYYKLWKDYSNMTDEEIAMAWQKVRMELVDCLHFFVNLLLCAGMTAEEVYEMYMAKNKENHRRQDAGYSADVSYREQPVEDVMQGQPVEDVMQEPPVEEQKAEPVEEAAPSTTEHVEEKPTCIVLMNGEAQEANNFIAVQVDKSGNICMTYNTTAVTLGRAVSALSAQYADTLSKYPEDAKKAIMDAVEKATTPEEVAHA